MFENVWAQKDKYVGDEKACKFIQKQVVGNILKDELVEQRVKEVNGLDMMQNTTIIHHIESIIEVQLISIYVFCFLIRSYTDGKFEHSEKPEFESGPSAIVYSMLSHHLMSYLFAIYRKFELKNRGKPDMNGVVRTSRESLLSTLEVLLASILFGYCINYFVHLESAADYHNDCYLNYWISIDMFLTVLLPAYVYAVKYFNLKSDLIQNIHTLVFVQ